MEPVTDSALRFEQQFAGQFIAFSAGELAEQATSDLLLQKPDFQRRYKPQPDLKWRENLAARLADLAAALNAGRPEIFANQVAWSRSAFAARRVPVDDLRASLEVLWRTTSAAAAPEDRPSIDAAFTRALERLDSAPDELPTELTANTPHGRTAAAYLLAILEGDRLGASRVVLDAAKAGKLTLRDAYLDVFRPVQLELGRMWHMNEITVAEEHFATATTQMVMAQLLPLAQRKPQDGRVMIAASVQGNAHDLGVRFVADFFELAGWRAIYLGPNVPVEDLVLAVQDFGAHLVALSATMPVQLRAAEDTVAALSRSDLDHKPKVMLGGRAFADCPDLWKTFGADGFAVDPDDAVRVADTLVPVPPPKASRPAAGA